MNISSIFIYSLTMEPSIFLPELCHLFVKISSLIIILSFDFSILVGFLI